MTTAVAGAWAQARRGAVAAALVAACVALGACGGAPVRDATGRPATGIDADADAVDARGLVQAMDRVERELRGSPLLVRDAALDAYLRSLACRLAGEACADIRVYVVDMPVFNASMAPNGMLQVCTGLLLRVDDEAELAYVLGHEIGHYRARHVLQQWRRLRRTEAFTGAFMVMTAGVGAGLVGSVAAIAGAAGVLAFSREQEREADRAGFATVVAHGYDAQAAVRLYAHLLDEERAREGRRPSAILATHPATAERLAQLRAMAASATAARGESSDGNETDDTVGRNPRSGDAELARLVRTHRGAWLDAELGRRHDAQTLVLLHRLREREPDDPSLGYALARVLSRRAAAGDLAAAERLLHDVLTQDGAPPAAARDLGLLRRRAGDRAAATLWLRDYLARAPGAADLALIVQYLAELQERSP